MSSLAVGLIVISAFTHALWNLIGKRERPTAAFFLSANIAGALCLMPFALLSFQVLAHIPANVWMLLCITGLFQTVYFTGLTNGYRHGELSIVYPAARGLPAVLVLLGSILLGRAHAISCQSAVGCMLVLAGCVILPMRRFRDFRVDNYRNLSSLFALTAALGTVGYSLIDDLALRQLRALPDLDLPVWQITGAYAFFEALFTCFWMAVATLPYRVVRTDLRNLLAARWPHALLTGVAISFTYVLVLISLAFVADVSYVVGFRQLSIPIGALLGIMRLKEPPHPPRVWGVLILFIGLILIATG